MTRSLREIAGTFSLDDTLAGRTMRELISDWIIPMQDELDRMKGTRGAEEERSREAPGSNTTEPPLDVYSLGRGDHVRVNESGAGKYFAASPTKEYLNKGDILQVSDARNGGMWVRMYGACEVAANPYHFTSAAEFNGLVNRCQGFAEMAHAGQRRRDDKTPYIKHCAKVASCFEWDTPAQALAWLHDAVEENVTTLSEVTRQLRLPRLVWEALDAISKIEGEDYDNYLKRVKKNELALRVKIADMRCNILDDPTPKQLDKYRKGLPFLSGRVVHLRAGQGIALCGNEERGDVRNVAYCTCVDCLRTHEAQR